MASVAARLRSSWTARLMWTWPWKSALTSPIPKDLPLHIPSIDTCPAPTCPCAAMPDGLNIDYKRPLSGTVPPYEKHILLCTGKSDWTSRIENEKEPNVARALKQILGPKGKLHDPYKNVMVTNTSFMPTSRDPKSEVSAYVLPDFTFFANVPSNATGVEEFASSLLTLPEKNGIEGVNFSEVMILICGHGGRDKRCGILGPLLKDEFERSLHRTGVQAKVGLVSHIGGHRFAGNVIIYLPPSHRFEDEKGSLAGKGVWYGRVAPRHVEGIVRETIMGGRLIKDLYRGLNTPS